MIKAILFDVDGTLYDETEPKAVAELLAAESISDHSGIDVEAVYSAFQRAKVGFARAHKGLPVANDRKKWYAETLRTLGVAGMNPRDISERYWRAVYAHMTPYLDFLYVAEELAEKYELYTLTDELAEIHQKKLEVLGVGKYFRRRISCEQVGETKPGQRLFDYAIAATGRKREEILIVGDNPSADIRGGNLAGIHTAWLRRGKYHYYPLEGLEKPEIAFANYIQLPEQIEGI